MEIRTSSPPSVPHCGARRVARMDVEREDRVVAAAGGVALDDRAPRVLRVFPRFLVRDVAESLAYYCDVLGFRAGNRSGEPPVFGIVESKSLFRGMSGSRCSYHARPEVMPYGYTEVDVVDLDGYVLCFGEECEARPGAS
jgi:hypothetical protein